MKKLHKDFYITINEIGQRVEVTYSYVKHNSGLDYHNLEGYALEKVTKDNNGFIVSVTGKFFIFGTLFSFEEYMEHKDVSESFKKYAINNLDNFRITNEN